MSSWLKRLASLYQVRPADLLGSAAGLHVGIPALINDGLPEPVLAGLGERTGLDVTRLRSMTRAGWAPWLFDTYPIEPAAADAMFGNYVRGDSVLFKPGTSKLPSIARFTWPGPWLPARPLHRVCPVYPRCKLSYPSSRPEGIATKGARTPPPSSASHSQIRRCSRRVRMAARVVRPRHSTVWPAE